MSARGLDLFDYRRHGAILLCIYFDYNTLPILHCGKRRFCDISQSPGFLAAPALALAWVLMTMEGPWIQGVISRKPDSETQLAAFGLMFSLSVLIETPVIMLLATGSALARNRQSFYVLWRFMMMVNVGVTIIAVLMAFTPLLDFYFGVMLHIPGHIIEATRPGMQIMIFWGGIIGFRRFHQGIIIRFGNTRVVGYGTVLRVIVSGSVALALGALTLMTGAVIGALALVLAVAAEAIFIHRVSRADVGRLLQTPLADKLQKLSYRDALRFHMPLAATSFVTLGIHPVIERGLASMPDATQSLAAWPVIFSILLVSRSGGMAYQEVVIALDASEQHHRVLRGFTLRLGFGLSSLMVIFVFSPLIEVYNSSILQVPRHLHHLVLLGTQAAFLCSAADDPAKLFARAADAQPQDRHDISGDHSRLCGDDNHCLGRHRPWNAWRPGRGARADHRPNHRTCIPVHRIS